MNTERNSESFFGGAEVAAAAAAAISLEARLSMGREELGTGRGESHRAGGEREQYRGKEI